MIAHTHDAGCICSECLPLPSRTVRVYRDGPEWKTGSKWWQLRGLAALHVASYRVRLSWDAAGDAQIAAFLAPRHPGCVYVY